jgi:hypothetical protein
MRAATPALPAQDRTEGPQRPGRAPGPAAPRSADRQISRGHDVEK